MLLDGLVHKPMLCELSTELFCFGVGRIWIIICIVIYIKFQIIWGIKLGTGGLARAYGGVASECLRNAPTCLVKTKVAIFLVCYASIVLGFKLYRAFHFLKGLLNSLCLLLVCGLMNNLVKNVGANGCRGSL